MTGAFVTSDNRTICGQDRDCAILPSRGRVLMRSSFDLRSRVFVLVLFCAFAAEAGERSLTFEDLMKFRQIRDASISEDGQWVAWALVPDRGDGEVVVRSTTSERRIDIERGSEPVFSADGLWVAASITPSTLVSAARASRSNG